MTSSTIREAIIGLLYIVLVAALVAVSILIFNHTFSSYTTVSLRTATAGNQLQKGSDVKVRGVLVGEVAAISTRGRDGAVVHLRLEPSKARSLPRDVTGQILPKTLFGEQYVNLNLPARPTGGHLKSGDAITPDTSPAAIELQQLFNDLLPVLQAINPGQLQATLGELKLALRGPVAGDLEHLVTTLGPYLQQLAPNVPRLAADLQQLTGVARTYTSAGPQIISALNTLTTTSRTLVAQRQDYENDLRSLTSLGDTVGGFVGTSQQQLIGVSVTSLPTLRTLAKYSSEFPCLTRALTAYLPKANRAFGVGTKQPGAHIVLSVGPRVGPYTAADTPRYDTGGPARCPYTPPTSLASTALANVPGVQGAAPTSNSTTPSTSPSSGLGTANSPQENQLIAELVGPTLGIEPKSVPRWASLLLGPVLRGMQMSLK